MAGVKLSKSDPKSFDEVIILFVPQTICYKRTRPDIGHWHQTSEQIPSSLSFSYRERYQKHVVFAPSAPPPSNFSDLFRSLLSKDESQSASQKMENLLGLLRIHVHRGVNLAIRDVRSSDPYVVIRMGKHKLKTRVVKRNLNPEWNDELTLSVADPSLSIKLMVYDKDKFSLDDKMGDAEIHIVPFLDALRMRLDDVPSGTVITKVKPGRDNCLAEESCIVWRNGKVVQDMVLRLRNVESGEVELRLEWMDIPGSRGL